MWDIKEVLKHCVNVTYLGYMKQQAVCLKVASMDGLPASRGDLHPTANLFSVGVLKTAVLGERARICGQI